MWSAAILSGGRAARFGGRDKSALMIDGQSILNRQIAELTRLTDDVMIVGSRDPVANDRARIIDDEVPDRGPLGGLQAALVAARADQVAVVACDMPYVSAALLAYMLMLTQDADAVVPRIDGRYHPLCAAYTRACSGPAATCLVRGALKMTDLLDSVRVRVVSTAEISGFGDHRRLLANINTPEEYASLEAVQGHQL